MGDSGKNLEFLQFAVCSCLFVPTQKVVAYEIKTVQNASDYYL